MILNVILVSERYKHCSALIGKSSRLLYNKQDVLSNSNFGRICQKSSAVNLIFYSPNFKNFSDIAPPNDVWSSFKFSERN